MSNAQRAPGINPTALSMIICDHVWRDPCEGKSTIIGTFTTLNADNFPFRHPVLAIYFALTDGHGDVMVKLRLIDVDDEHPPIFEIMTNLRFNVPHDIVEKGVEIGRPLFPRAGEYRLQMFTNGELLIERRLSVRSRLRRSAPEQPYS